MSCNIRSAGSLIIFVTRQINLTIFACLKLTFFGNFISFSFHNLQTQLDKELFKFYLFCIALPLRKQFKHLFMHAFHFTECAKRHTIRPRMGFSQLSVSSFSCFKMLFKISINLDCFDCFHIDHLVLSHPNVLVNCAHDKKICHFIIIICTLFI